MRFDQVELLPEDIIPYGAHCYNFDPESFQPCHFWSVSKDGEVGKCSMLKIDDGDLFGIELYKFSKECQVNWDYKIEEE